MIRLIKVVIVILVNWNISSSNIDKDSKNILYILS